MESFPAAHGGFIHVESKLGKGHNFMLFFLPQSITPLLPPMFSPGGSISLARFGTRSVGGTGKSLKHVLIVDDDRDVGRFGLRREFW